MLPLQIKFTFVLGSFFPFSRKSRGFSLSLFSWSDLATMMLSPSQLERRTLRWSSETTGAQGMTAASSPSKLQMAPTSSMVITPCQRWSRTSPTRAACWGTAAPPLPWRGSAVSALWRSPWPSRSSQWETCHSPRSSSPISWKSPRSLGQRKHPLERKSPSMPSRRSSPPSGSLRIGASAPSHVARAGSGGQWSAGTPRGGWPPTVPLSWSPATCVPVLMCPARSGSWGTGHPALRRAGKVSRRGCWNVFLMMAACCHKKAVSLPRNRNT